MSNYTTSKTSYSKTIGLSLAAILLASAMVIYPDVAFKASLQGLKIWWEIIFPALLPFFITAEILLGFGVVHFMGVLLEPLMKPLFNVPGVGAFALAMGFASGYPMGAKLTSRLREQKLITRIEGERLVSFTSTSDPLFLFGAIAVGFFHDVRLGAFLAFIHYSSSLIVGFIMRFYKKKELDLPLSKTHEQVTNNIIVRAFKEMHQARFKDGRKLGKLMGDAVMTSIETLLMIGGFIMIFSVILAILTKISITLLFTQLIKALLLPLGISPDLANSIIYGMFEVTNGVKSVSESSFAIPLVEKLAIVGAISAWSGISVHAQVAAILQKTDIRYSPYFLARIMHTIIAFFITLIIWKPFNLDQMTRSIPAFMYQIPNQTSFPLWHTFMYLGTHLLFIFIILIILSLTIYLLKRRYNQR